MEGPNESPCEDCENAEILRLTNKITELKKQIKLLTNYQELLRNDVVRLQAALDKRVVEVEELEGKLKTQAQEIFEAIAKLERKSHTFSKDRCISENAIVNLESEYLKDKE